MAVPSPEREVRRVIAASLKATLSTVEGWSETPEYDQVIHASGKLYEAVHGLTSLADRLEEAEAKIANLEEALQAREEQLVHYQQKFGVL